MPHDTMLPSTAMQIEVDSAVIPVKSTGDTPSSQGRARQ
jgi:hypothetical protein